MSFLPNGYEKPATNSNYYKFEPGDNKVRILGSAITGWKDWDEKTPIRVHDKPERSIDPKKPVKHFWAFPVWSYRDKAVKILEIVQSTIQEAIYNLCRSEVWGDPKNYDLNVCKAGEGLETEYSIMPVPPRPVHPEIARIYSETPINLNALFTNADPFARNGVSTPPQVPTEGQVLDAGYDLSALEKKPEIKLEDIPF